MNIGIGRQLLVFSVVVLLWQIASPWLAQFAVPGPVEIARAWLELSPIMAPHLASTLLSSAIGLIIAAVTGLLLGIGLHLSRWVGLVLYGPMLVLFTLPSLVLSPLFILLMPQGVTPIAMAIVTSFFPVVIGTQRGLADTSSELRRLFRMNGANKLHTLRFLEIPGAIPSIVTGLQVASTWALLGSMLGEFAGGRWGIGILMLGMLGRGDPAYLWATALTVTLFSLFCFSILGMLRRAAARRLGLSSDLRDTHIESDKEAGTGPFVSALSSAVIFAFGLRLLLPLPSPLVLNPWEVIARLGTSTDDLERLAIAFYQTVSVASAALLIGLLIALAWAITAHIFPIVGRAINPIALLTQAVPLTAIAPLFILVLGRHLAASLCIAVLAIVFPAYSTIFQRLEDIPIPAANVIRTYTRSRFAMVRYLELPWSGYAIFSALRIAAPRVLLGVMLAEYIATGQGLGFLLIEAKGRLSYEIIWAIIYVTAFFGITLFFGSTWLERQYGRFLNRTPKFRNS
jgi:ABC-type nitrate/sulfonate/bicarbonate transport system permease component